MLSDNIKRMLEFLDTSALKTADPPDAQPLQVVRRVRTGKRGRPKVEIDHGFLEEAVNGVNAGPRRISTALHVSARTVRREILAHGLAEPAQPLFEEHENEDGTTTCVRNHPPPKEQTLSDEELDTLVYDILQVFPQAGKSIIHGAIRSQGHVVTGERLSASYLRVHGAPAPFGSKPIERRTYSVAGPNSLWHHDGQHGKPSLLLLRCACLGSYDVYQA